MLRERLIFGTARLSGGPYAPLARELIAICLDAGITAFDTAPSYGMGAAEGLLGAALAGRRDVRIATKVGAPRPAWPGLRGWGKRIRRLAGRPSVALASPRSHRGPAAGYRYDAASVTASIARSLRALRRDTLDLVLLHEARPEEAPEAATMLEASRTSGVATTIGFAHGGVLGRPAPDGWVAQAAAAPADFFADHDGAAAGVFHSIRVAATTLTGERAARLDKLEATLPVGDTATRRLGAGLLALHRAHRTAGLTVATTDPVRLRSLLELVDAIEREGLDR